VGHLKFSADELCIPQYIDEGQLFNSTYSINIGGYLFLDSGRWSLINQIIENHGKLDYFIEVEENNE